VVNFAEFIREAGREIFEVIIQEFPG